ncbi:MULTISPECIES: dienelactone hydrolase family protein [Actinomadura]|uniref:Dienelactone hydrolase family protein n=1 Tax=Actinomadura yumaensis TaxID=111807 RepID=A0ABW2CG91_9ACTN|nr:dienelactone hydrolase family protein [Actinomadura sp. J1-007]MWK39949.1 prolyl oligopeptidase family serine peptidase [Actinomadura sp. J1-007]
MNHADTSRPTTASWITLDTADGPMRVYTAEPVPAGGSGARAGSAVVVLQEAFGVNDHVQDITRRFAARGRLALAPDLFHRNGAGVLGYDRHAEAMPLIGAIGPDAIATDVRAVLDHLAASEGIAPGAAALVGFCFGGRAAFTAATAIPGLAAAVVFYGPGIAAGPHAVLDRAEAIDAPLMLHVGAEDPVIPPDDVAAIQAALREAGADFEQHLYPGAGHAFACDARPHLYREEAAATAWGRTHAFLDRRLPAAEERRAR